LLLFETRAADRKGVTRCSSHAKRTFARTRPEQRAGTLRAALPGSPRLRLREQESRLETCAPGRSKALERNSRGPEAEFHHSGSGCGCVAVCTSLPTAACRLAGRAELRCDCTPVLDRGDDLSCPPPGELSRSSARRPEALRCEPGPRRDDELLHHALERAGWPPAQHREYAPTCGAPSVQAQDSPRRRRTRKCEHSQPGGAARSGTAHRACRKLGMATRCR